MVKNPPANARVMGSIPGLGKSPGVGEGNLPQQSCLGNSMDKGARALHQEKPPQQGARAPQLQGSPLLVATRGKSEHIRRPSTAKNKYTDIQIHRQTKKNYQRQYEKGKHTPLLSININAVILNRTVFEMTSLVSPRNVRLVQHQQMYSHNSPH